MGNDDLKSCISYNKNSERDYGYYLTIAKTMMNNEEVRNNKSLKVLDLGCNKGFLVKAFREMEADSYGCDISHEALSSSPTEIRDYLKLLDITTDKLPFDNEEFDLITMLDVVEHLSSFDLTLSELNRVLRTRGLIYISTPSPLTNMYCDDPTHINVHSKSFWINLFEKHGFTYINEFPKKSRNEALSFLKKSKIQNLIYKICSICFMPNLRSDIIFQKL